MTTDELDRPTVDELTAQFAEHRPGCSRSPTACSAAPGTPTTSSPRPWSGGCAPTVLHEVFELPHDEVAGILGITTAASRQHLHRARTRVHRDTRRSDPDVHDETLRRFLAALEHGDLGAVQDLMAADVAAYSDGGGKTHAARRPIVGAGRVVDFFGALRRRFPVRDVRLVEANGRSAAMLRFGRYDMLLALEVRDGTVREIHSILDPDKLRHLHHQLDEAPGSPTRSQG